MSHPVPENILYARYTNPSRRDNPPTTIPNSVHNPIVLDNAVSTPASQPHSVTADFIRNLPSGCYQFSFESAAQRANTVPIDRRVYRLPTFQMIVNKPEPDNRGPPARMTVLFNTITSMTPLPPPIPQHPAPFHSVPTWSSVNPPEQTPAPQLAPPRNPVQVIARPNNENSHTNAAAPPRKTALKGRFQETIAALDHVTHGNWTQCTKHTAKCDVCERKNTGSADEAILQRCICGMQFCRKCIHKKVGKDGQHHEPEGGFNWKYGKPSSRSPPRQEAASGPAQPRMGVFRTQPASSSNSGQKRKADESSSSSSSNPRAARRMRPLSPSLLMSSDDEDARRPAVARASDNSLPTSQQQPDVPQSSNDVLLKHASVAQILAQLGEKLATEGRAQA